jgi:predicted transcriptional regulator
MSETVKNIQVRARHRMGAPTKRIGVAGPRKMLKLTQEHVAEQMGITQGQVSKIEAAEDAIEVRTLRSYAEALGAVLEVCITVDGVRLRVL